MDALKAFLEHTGYSKVPYAQYMQAKQWGGLNDPQTIKSIPWQIEQLKLKYFLENAKAPTIDDIAGSISLKSFDRILKESYQFQPNHSMPEVARVEAIELLITYMYVTVFNRMPDEEGFEYWVDQFDLKVEQLLEDMLSGATKEDLDNYKS